MLMEKTESPNPKSRNSPQLKMKMIKEITFNKKKTQNLSSDKILSRAQILWIGVGSVYYIIFNELENEIKDRSDAVTERKISK